METRKLWKLRRDAEQILDNTRKVTVKILEKSTVKIGEEKFLPNLRITVVFEEDILSSENKSETCGAQMQSLLRKTSHNIPRYCVWRVVQKERQELAVGPRYSPVGAYEPPRARAAQLS